MKKLALSALLLALVASAKARADEVSAFGTEAPPAGKWGSVELGAGPYRPSIDKGVSGSPYHTIFGGSPGPMFRLHIGKVVYSGLGVLEVGLKTGFFSKSGNAVYSSNLSMSSPDRTSFNFIPTSLTLTYRTDFLYEQLGWPLDPYARVSFERYNWWVTKGSKFTEKGATNGYSGTLGLEFIIDFLDPDAGRDLNQETGIAHTALYLDVTKSKVNDFGSKKSWDLSEDLLFWSGGLLVSF